MADKPVTREEKYLAYLTGDYKGEIPKPITRKEKYLYELCLKGIGGEISPEEIKNAVNEYLEKNPVKPGATTEQAQQIEQNKTNIASLKEETSSLKEDKITKPAEAPTIGKILRVKSVNEDGTFVCEWADGGGSNLDVRIDGESIVQDGVAEIPLCTTSTAPGLISIDLYSNNGGLYRANEATGLIRIANAENASIDKRENSFCPIVPENLDYAVKAAMCDGKGATWTADEQAAARERMNAADKRKLDALWKLNQGISYDFQTDDTEAYQKTVPSGTKVASVKSIGGKTIVWNQLNSNNEESNTKNGISFINNKDGSWTITGTCSVSNDDNTSISICGFAGQFVSGHKYLAKADKKYFDENYGFAINSIEASLEKAKIINYAFNPIIFVKDKVTVDNVTMRMNIFDLTQMFGSGNEPSTPEEFEAMFPSDYYPYNAGKLMSASVNEVIYLDTKNQETSYPIPQAVLKLGGYGNGIDDVCNYVDWENKKYHKRVGRYIVTGDEQFYSQQTYIGDNSSDAYMNMDIGQKQSTDAKLISNKLLYSKWCWSIDQTYDAICLNSTQIHIRIQNSSLGITNEASPVEVQNAVKKYCKNLYESGDPIIIYYELAEEEITDISEIIDDTFQEPLEVEAGGTLTFRNTNGDDYRIPVPSSEEYVISLAEVAK